MCFFSLCALLCTVKKCYCCVPLRWSTFAIAIVYIVLSVLFSMLYGIPMILHWINGEDKDLSQNSTLFFFYITSISMILQTVGGVVLIIAVIRKSPSWMWPWICVSFFQCAAVIIAACLCSLVYVYQNRTNTMEHEDEVYFHDDNDSLTYFVYAIYGFVLLYASCVVNSYRKELQADNRSDSIEMAPLSAA